jgi:hypothetical protein
VDARIGVVNVDLTEPPGPGQEMYWTKPYFIDVFAREWVDHILDILEGSEIRVGGVSIGGTKFENFCTLRGISQALLSGDKVTEVRCEVCGNHTTWPAGKLRLTGSPEQARSVIVNSRGLFIAETIYKHRMLRQPTGSFPPKAIGYVVR